MISSISSSWSAERNCFITKHLLPELFRSLNKSFVDDDVDDDADDVDGADNGNHSRIAGCQIGYWQTYEDRNTKIIPIPIIPL